MKRFTFASVSAILLAVTVNLIGATAEGQSRIAEDQTAELKGLQKERIATLTQMVDLLSRQFQSGATANFSKLSAAQNELYDAKLDATDNSEERIALLEEQLKTMASIQKQTEEVVAAGAPGATQADVLSAKSLYLKIKIRLVRERSKAPAKAK